MDSKQDLVIYSRYTMDTGSLRILKVDAEFTRMLGYTQEDVEKQKLTQKDIMFREDWDDYVELLARVRGNMGAAYISHRLRKKGGEGLFVFCFGEDVYNEKEKRIEAQILITDVTNNQALKDELSYKNQLLEQVMNNVAGGIAVYEVKAERVRLQFLSKSFYEMMDLPDWNGGFRLETLKEYLAENDLERVMGSLMQAAEEHCNVTTDYVFCHPDDKKRWIQVRFSGFQVAEERNIVVATFSDVTERKQKELTLLDKASRDSLTGIYNHTVYVEKVEKWLSQKKAGWSALLMMDVDGFKQINDVLGHDEGDLVLKRLVERVKNQLHPYAGESLFGRMGGDEFSLFFPEIKGREEMRNVAKDVVAAGRNCLEGMETSVSVGVSLRYGGAENFRQMYHEADQALYYVKRRGKGSYAFFRQDILEQRQDDSRMAGERFGYLEDLGLALDDMENIVCISDLDTYDLLYVNEAAKRAFEDEETGSHWEGMTSYRYIWNADKPMVPYPLENLTWDKSFMWEAVNPKNGRRYILRDRAVWWKGRMARLEMAIDVTQMSDVESALAARFDVEDILQKCISSILRYEDFQSNYKQMLGFVGDFYEADCVNLVKTNAQGVPEEVYEWCLDGVKSQKKRVEAFVPGEEDPAYLKLLHKKMVLVVDQVMKIRKSFPNLYEKLRGMGVWAFYSLPLFKGDELAGQLMVFNCRRHMGELTVLSVFGLFLMNELERKEAWERQQYELTHDALTGLYNRDSYMEYLEQLEDVDSIGIVCADVNGLKQINDDFGYGYGNNIVCEIGDILRDVFKGYYVARFDGDDFNICCVNIERQHFMELVQEARRRFAMHSNGAAVGYAWDDFEIDTKRMNAHAEEIMKVEKQRYYENLAEHSVYQQQEIINMVKDYVRQKLFRIFLQPKVDLKSGKCCGAEALTRLKQAEKLRMPSKFIPFLEKTETIQYLDLYVLEEMCRLLERWKRERKPMLPISLNFSRKTLLASDLAEKVEAVLNRYDVDRSFLEIEITETIGDLEYDMIVRIADELHGRGLRLAMDDFGIKYSSVYILSLMKFETLKLDRSMVNNLAENQISRKVAAHVIEMCRDLGIRCVAEGVETEAQEDFLQKNGCDMAQGYLYGRPQPVHCFEERYL